MSNYISGGEDQIAKRNHKAPCNECGCRIKKGRGFRALVFEDCGSIGTYKLCGRCARWADIFESDTGEREWAAGDIEQYRFDAIRDALGVRNRKRKALNEKGEE